MKEDVTENNYYIGMEVVRGRDWKWANQDKFPGNIGIIESKSRRAENDDWVSVYWKNGNSNSYRIGPDYFDLYIHNEIHELW